MAQIKEKSERLALLELDFVLEKVGPIHLRILVMNACVFFSDYIIGKQFSCFCDPSNLAKCFGHLLYIKQLGHHSVD